MTANVDAPPATISTTVITSRAVAGPAHRGATIRLGRRSAAIVLALLGLLIVAATDQILPATSDRQAELRYWLAARATGIVALTLLALQVAFGLVLSHPHNKTTWKLSKRVFPWHDHLWVFVMAFLVVHVLSLVADPKSGVDVLGAVVPGLSRYRNAAVALGTLALYAFLVTAVTARQTKLLPPGRWLTLHRLAAGILVLSWVHGMLAGTDSAALRPWYVVIAVLITLAGAYRYWSTRGSRATVATIPERAA